MLDREKSFSWGPGFELGLGLLEFDLDTRSLSASLFVAVFTVLAGIDAILLELGSEVGEISYTVGTLVQLREGLGHLGAKGDAAG